MTPGAVEVHLFTGLGFREEDVEMFDRQVNNQVILEIVSKNRREETMNEAHRARILNEAFPQRLTLLDRFLIQIGGILIAMGKRLQGRCVLVVPQGTKPHPSKS